jgi:hypothetical protein
MDQQPHSPEIPEVSHAYLVQINKPQAGKHFALKEEVVTLGRASGSSLVFPGDDSISRQHARIINRLGLFWLEDLGSTNGTFYTPPGGEERQLNPNEPVLLLEDSLFRIGIHRVFKVKGMASSQNEATQRLRQRLQGMLLNLYQNLAQYPPAQQQTYLEAIRRLQEQIGAARNEEELALLASQGMQNLHESMAQTARFLQPERDQTAGDPFDLPPLPDDLPDPGDPKRLRTILNTFISDIRVCFPNSTQQHEQD